MARFDKGVRFYTDATLTMTVHFPEDDVRCGWCQFMKKDATERLYCSLTHDLLVSDHFIGRDCPLILPVSECEQTHADAGA